MIKLNNIVRLGISIIMMSVICTGCGLPNPYQSTYFPWGDRKPLDGWIEDYMRNEPERMKEIKYCEKIPEKERKNHVCSAAIDAQRRIDGLPSIYLYIDDHDREQLVRMFMDAYNSREREAKLCKNIPKEERHKYGCSSAMEAKRRLKGLPPQTLF